MVSVQGEIGQPGQAPGAIADAAQPESSPAGAGRRTDGPSFSSRLARLRVSTATLIALAAIVSIPAAFVAVTRGEWLLDIGGEDNWIYIKYFTVWTSAHPELRQVMDQHYKATRVPWILPGFLAYRLFGPLAGDVRAAPAGPDRRRARLLGRDAAPVRQRRRRCSRRCC